MIDRCTDGESLVFRLGPRRIERADVLAFAAAFDPQPAHLDEGAARATPLRGLAASGWHTCALIADDLEKALADNGDYLGMASIDELRWLRPVRPGDELLAEVKWGASSPCVCEPTFERRPAQVEARNQLGEIVVRWSCHMLFGRPTHERKAIAHTPAALCEARRPRPTKATSRPGEHFIKYFEDVLCGDETELGSYVFDSPNVAMFESLLAGDCKWPEEARVSGWHVMAAWMSLIIEYYERQARRLAAAGLPVPTLGPATGLKWLRWLTPVSIGDQVTFRSWVEHKVNAAGTGRWGLLVAGGEGRNGRGELVVSFYPQFLLERRPRSADGIRLSLGAGSGE